MIVASDLSVAINSHNATKTLSRLQIQHKTIAYMASGKNSLVLAISVSISVAFLISVYMNAERETLLARV